MVMRQNDLIHLHNSPLQERGCQIFMISRIPPITAVYHKTGMLLKYRRVSKDQNLVELTSLIVNDPVK